MSIRSPDSELARLGDLTSESHGQQLSLSLSATTWACWRTSQVSGCSDDPVPRAWKALNARPDEDDP